MTPKTWLVDFAPKITKETPGQLRKKKYVDNLLETYDLGDVEFIGTVEECNRRGPEEKPDVIICTYEYGAREIKDSVPEAVLYVVEGTSSIFYRKTDAPKKIEENIKIFKDAAETVQRIKDATDEEREHMRKFHAMTYDETYKMITKALISEDEDLRKKAWDLLWGPGEKNSNIIWMRVQMMAEVWEGSKGERLEQLMLMSMEQHIDFGLARKMDSFEDADGQKYHQYMFLDPYGSDMNYIRRLPFADKDQDRYSYEASLEKCEIPTNYMRIQLEATQFKKQVDEYLAVECEKVRTVLKKNEKDPTLSKQELGVAPTNHSDSKSPLSESELQILRNFLQKYGV